MFCKRLLEIMKARTSAQKQKKQNVFHSALMIVEFPVSQNCKQKRDINTFCLKCGACGRKFDSYGIIKEE